MLPRFYARAPASLRQTQRLPQAFAPRFYSADQSTHVGQVQNQQYQDDRIRFHRSEISNFQSLVDNQQILKAVQNYAQLKKSEDWRHLNYDSLHKYLIMLCKHRPSGSVALSSHRVYDLVESALRDLHSHPKSFRLNKRLYPVLLHFYVTLGRYQKAVDLYEEMLQNGVPQTVESYVSMIVCYQKLGHAEHAIRVYETAKQDCHDLMYSRYLADRTVMRVYAQIGELSQARAIRDILLAECAQKSPEPKARDLTKTIHLSFLDACADAKKPEAFIAALKDFQTQVHHFDTEAFNHIIINLAKLGQFGEMVQFMDWQGQLSRPLEVKGFAGRAKEITESFFKSVSTTLRDRLSATTYSDALFELSKASQTRLLLGGDAEKRNLVVLAERVYSRFHHQLIRVLDQYWILAQQIRQQHPHQDSHAQIPYHRLFNMVLKNNNSFVAMAMIYKNVGRIQDAVEILKAGARYQKFITPQIRHIFGEDYMSVQGLDGVYEDKGRHVIEEC